MEYNEIIHNQLIDYISSPAVLMTKDDVPYEFRDKGSIQRLKRRRINQEIPLELYSFLIQQGIPKDKLREFASGLFLNYIETIKIYT